MSQAVRGWPRGLVVILILGLYLTLRGYHSRDNDQAYRLPLLLHRQDPSLFADDPFVRAFEAFNPHRGMLALLDAASRAVGLSAALAGLFALTFVVTCLALDRLARAVWPGDGPGVGLVAVGLILTAKAGNIGTNHLFEAMLLDRLVGFALGWLALALIVEDPRRSVRGTLAIGLATLVHPSIGLQLTMLMSVGWLCWAVFPARTGVTWREAFRAIGALGLAIAPGLALNLAQGSQLTSGLPTEEFRLLSVELQGPQHMLPHLWRTSQWLAWGCYPVLALLALGRIGRVAARPPWPDARGRLAILLAINLAGIGLAWFGVEVIRDLRLTLFQPFRMATICRGLALVAVSDRILAHWRSGHLSGRARAALLSAGLMGDWSLVVATLVELGMTGIEAVRSLGSLGETDFLGSLGRTDFSLSRMKNVLSSGQTEVCPAHPTPRNFGQRAAVTPCGRQGNPRDPAGGLILLGGLWFLARHDPESGHWPLLGAIGVAWISPWLGRLIRPGFVWNPRRMALGFVACWAVPLAALLAALDPASMSGHPRPWARGLLDRCRFAAVPTDDIERLAVWCRENTPRSARFVGPPGPKTFRLWSLRSVAFNRASSPYHARGLADWAARFRDHVGFEGTTAEFVRAYQTDRHGLERHYQAMSDTEHAALAQRQGATHVIAAPPVGDRGSDCEPLELLHVEGRYAVYRVRVGSLAGCGPRTDRSIH